MEDRLKELLFATESVTLNRSDIKFSDYNPRVISKEGKAALKRSLKKFGVVGGIVVNKQTGYTIVGGHQKVSILDEICKYDPNDPSTDYSLRVEVGDWDITTEKELNIALNNPNVGGDWDFDKLASLVPDIDYKNAGLTESDLSMIGLDYMFQTPAQQGVADELSNIMAPVEEQHRAEVEQRAQERAAQREMERQAAEEEIAQQSANAEQIAREEAEREARVQHMKDVKQQVREQAIENAQNMDAYVVLSFSTFKAKADFCQRFGYNAMERTIKGEDFDRRCEVSLEDDELEDDE